MNPILKPLTFSIPTQESSILESKVHKSILNPEPTKCLLCSELYKLPQQKDALLGHLLIAHKLVIADVKEVADLNVYLDYWREQFCSKENPLKEYCFTFSAQLTREDSPEETEDYYMLADDLPEDKDLRIQLQKERLQLVLDQQKREREDAQFTRTCLFCRKTLSGNRKDLLEHMNFDHNFSIGQADNIVFIDEFLNILEAKLQNLECLYCERVFKDRTVLKEHMRKKQHKKINPQNHFYDKFYVVNYLEPGKTWKEIMEERDEMMQRRQPRDDDKEWSDWEEEEQPHIVCLFCQFSPKDSSAIFQHMQQKHQFDLPKLRETNSWNFYEQVKIVNYIRRQVHQKKCILCEHQFDSEDALLFHMEDKRHLLVPDRQIWDQAEFYFPTYENDALLYLLEDGTNATESQVAVIPEDRITSTSILEEESVRKELL